MACMMIGNNRLQRARHICQWAIVLPGLIAVLVLAPCQANPPAKPLDKNRDKTAPARPRQCAPVKCTACQKPDYSGACPVCTALPDSPPIVPPQPSVGPEATVDYQHVATYDWGHNDARYKLTSTCSSFCQGGQEKIAFTGDVVPDGYTIVVYGLLKGATCNKRARSDESIRRTIAHEMEHRRYYLALFNQAKAKTGVLHDGVEACLRSRDRWLDQFHQDFEALRERQEKHLDFAGETKYGEACDGTISVELPAGAY